MSMDDFTNDILVSKRVVLVACIHRDYEYKEQLANLRAISYEYGDKLRVCLLDVSYLKAFMQEFNINGTPTLLIFADGQEQDRLLGKVDQEALKAFVLSAAPYLAT